jgi:hypothetical protein
LTARGMHVLPFLFFVFCSITWLCLLSCLH